MPQLNPSPWFLILLLTWTVLITTLLNKTLYLKLTNPPTPKELKQNPTETWTWPWY